MGGIVALSTCSDLQLLGHVLTRRASTIALRSSFRFSLFLVTRAAMRIFSTHAAWRKARMTELVLPVVLALLACREKKTDPPAPASARPAVLAPCPDGVSVDPQPGELRPAITAADEKDYATSKKL